MTTLNREMVKLIVSEALERPQADRKAFVSHACGGDGALQKEVDSLLAEADGTRGFLDLPAAVEHAGRLTRSLANHWIGRRVGAYKIVREIARGGMGEVYHAVRDDAQYHQEVAIKLVRRGLDSPALVERFRTERQILASLEHPSIARLLDGGVTDEALPYLVMELVNGEPVDSYCNTHKLSIANRLEIFRTICSAVHFAHQRLVVHRDLKPSNILVTADGTVKLLDFGIAKVLDVSSPAEPAATLLHAMTPHYSSPEQIRGESVTTATDIYSLGVVLYHMLTGKSPYPITSIDSYTVAKAVCESDPLRPSVASGESATRRQLSGDLDAIVLKALRKTPGDRYASAEQFADDVRRHLQHEPVRAREGNLTYLASRYVARHKLAVAAAGVVAVTLIGGIIATTQQANAARAERDRAEAEKARAEKHFASVRTLANSLLGEIHDAVEKTPGATAARQVILKNALQYLNELSQDAPRDPKLRLELASSYRQIAQIQGGESVANVGETAAALENYRKAIDLLNVLHAEKPGDQDVLRAVARTYRELGAVQAARGSEVALATLQNSVTAAEKAYTLDRQSTLNVDTLGMALLEYGRVRGRRIGNDAEALSAIDRGYELFSTWVQQHPDDALAVSRLAWASNEAGHAYVRYSDSKSNLEAALKHYGHALAIYEQKLAANPVAGTHRGVAASLRNVGRTLLKLERTSEAIPVLLRSSQVIEDLARADPQNVQAAKDLAYARLVVADTLLQAKQIADAHRAAEQALAHYQLLTERYSDDIQVRTQGLEARQTMATILLRRAGDASASRTQRIADVQQARRMLRQSEEELANTEATSLRPRFKDRHAGELKSALTETDTLMTQLAQPNGTKGAALAKQSR